MAAAQKAGTSPYVGQFDPFADIKVKAAALPAYLQRPGTPHAAAAPSLEPVRLSVTQVCKRMRMELQSDYDPVTYGWLTERYGDAGVPEDVVAGLIAARRQALAPVAQPAGLRAVGGGK